MTVSVQVERLPVRIEPDASRVLSRFFWADEEKTRRRIARVMTLSEREVENIVLEMLQLYVEGHYDIAATWLEHFERVKALLPTGCGPLSSQRQMLIGAYFTMDYALESVALFNPSIVEALDQSNLEPGAKRFMMSLRAVGEGHLSSIVMRNGIIDAAGNIILKEPALASRALARESNPEFSTTLSGVPCVILGPLAALRNRY